MVCYARPASRLAALLIVALLVFGRSVGHFLDTAAILVGALAATGGAAIAAALVFAALASTRRRRAAAGGCVSCQFRCQHAMTGPSRRLWLVNTADRHEPGPAHPARTPSSGRPGPVLLPTPAIRPARAASGASGVAGASGAAGAGGASGFAGAGGVAPRWPDRPLYRASRQQERVRSSA
jgi:hypothetical protein